MSIFTVIKTDFNKIPKPIVRFAIKALVLFILWQIVYTTLFLPERILDEPLSSFTGKATAHVLNFIYGVKDIHTKEIMYTDFVENTSFSYLKTVLFWDNKRLLGIADSCNGLNLYVLFVGFILIYPARKKLKLLFGITGLMIIIATNIMRCIGLVILAQKHPSFVPFAHHYLYKIITYAVVFGLWVWFIKLQEKSRITNA